MSSSDQTGTDVPQAPQPGFPPPRPGPEHWWRHFHWHRYRFPQRGRAFSFIARWDSPVYALLVGIGLPLEALFAKTLNDKHTVLTYFFALTTTYLLIELAEMIMPVLRDGVVRETNANAQIDSTQLLKYWGAQGPVVVWVVVLGIYCGVYWPFAGLWENTKFMFWAVVWDTPLWYGPLEWFVIVHSYFIGKLSAYFLNLLLFILLKAFPRAERIEEQAAPRPAS